VATPANWLDVNVLYFQYFLLVLARMTTMVALAPLLGSRNVPIPAKIGLGFLLSVIIAPFVVRDFPAIPHHFLLFTGMLIREVLVGLLMGVLGAALFAAVQLSGQIFGMMIGFGIVNVMDPMSEMQISILGQFEFLIAILLFMAVGGHHLLIMAMANSYAVIPVNSFTVTAALAEQIGLILGNMFAIAFKVGFPMIAAIFLIKVAMGLVARTVPQMNVFIVGLPLNIFVGLIVMGLSLTYVTFLLKGYFNQFFTDLYMMWRIAAGQ
jgi:flagellar biosynthetic protein FliR